MDEELLKRIMPYIEREVRVARLKARHRPVAENHAALRAVTSVMEDLQLAIDGEGRETI